MRLICLSILSALTLSACMAPVEVQKPTRPAPTQPVTQPKNVSEISRMKARNFVQVMQKMEPVIEQECRQRAPRLNCDYRIVVDDNPKAPPNAFQTVDRSGRPIIGFTLGLIAMADNRDELAFVLGHEASHHIAGHLQRQSRNATLGAVILGQIAGAAGAGAQTVQAAQKIGATVGARSYSKDYEIEADTLGTIITKRAGYNPVRGAAFFARIPDPGDRFLGTHPPNAQRQANVRRVAAGL